VATGTMATVTGAIEERLPHSEQKMSSASPTQPQDPQYLDNSTSPPPAGTSSYCENLTGGQLSN